MVNPTKHPIVVISECFLLSPCLPSGINSSTTTYIIAPAAKDNAYGNMGRMDTTANAPITPEIGSTTPDAWPNKKAFLRDTPSRLKGIDTAAPSGKFCRPIPIAKAAAPAREADGNP